MSTIRDVLADKGSVVYTVDAAASVLDAVAGMCKLCVGALLAVDDERRTPGILSERDVIVRVVLPHRDPATTHVADVMTRELVSVEPDTPVPTAMALMTEHRSRHLVVLEDQAIVGLVSIGDLLRWAHHEQEEEVRLLREYVSSACYA
jgi:signal-transduction protein with cAMP-binding, CBS, and nucleotidyltransferase domain